MIRLSLRQRVTWLVSARAAVLFAGVMWFVSLYVGCRTRTQEVIELCSVGLLVTAVGGTCVPTLTGRAELEAKVSGLFAEDDELTNAVSGSGGIEAALTERIETLGDSLPAAEREPERLHLIV